MFADITKKDRKRIKKQAYFFRANCVKSELFFQYIINYRLNMGYLPLCKARNHQRL